jgi:hypothetical protein
VGFLRLVSIIRGPAPTFIVMGMARATMVPFQADEWAASETYE